MKILFQKATSTKNNPNTEFFNSSQKSEKAEKLFDKEEFGWPNIEHEEGQLAIDVYETSKNIVVKSTIAGVNSKDIEISLNNDMLTVKGERKKEELEEVVNYLYQECFWGKFSRTIILPIEVKANKVSATLEEGVLTIILPIDKAKKQRVIKVKEILSK